MIKCFRVVIIRSHNSSCLLLFYLGSRSCQPLWQLTHTKRVSGFMLVPSHTFPSTTREISHFTPSWAWTWNYFSSSSLSRFLLARHFWFSIEHNVVRVLPLLTPQIHSLIELPKHFGLVFRWTLPLTRQVASREFIFGEIAFSLELIEIKYRGEGKDLTRN